MTEPGGQNQVEIATGGDGQSRETRGDHRALREVEGVRDGRSVQGDLAGEDRHGGRGGGEEREDEEAGGDRHGRAETADQQAAPTGAGRGPIGGDRLRDPAPRVGARGERGRVVREERREPADVRVLATTRLASLEVAPAAIRFRGGELGAKTRRMVRASTPRTSAMSAYFIP